MRVTSFKLVKIWLFKVGKFYVCMLTNPCFTNVVHSRMAGCCFYLILQRLCLIKRGQHVVSRKKKTQNKHKFQSFILFHSSVVRSLKTSTNITLFFLISFKRCQNSQSKHKFHSFILLHSSVVRKGFICCLHVRPVLVAEVNRTHLAYNHPSKRFR